MYKNRLKQWSDKELRYIKRWYGKKSIIDIANHLGRSPVSVCEKANTALNLKFSRYYPKTSPYYIKWQDLYRISNHELGYSDPVKQPASGLKKALSTIDNDPGEHNPFPPVAKPSKGLLEKEISDLNSAIINNIKPSLISCPNKPSRNLIQRFICWLIGV